MHHLTHIICTRVGAPAPQRVVSDESTMKLRCSCDANITSYYSLAMAWWAKHIERANGSATPQLSLASYGGRR